MSFNQSRRSMFAPKPGRTPAELAAHDAILAQVRREFVERFPTLTADNAQTALDWQAARINSLLQQQSHAPADRGN
jgi:hypothetical protein